jgi:23S rRNA (cytosine1962-C5)-methyltransferase
MDSNTLSTIELIKGKEINLQRRHPWIFSGALKEIPTHLEDGELVYINSSTKHRLGFGHFHRGSIAVKILEFGNLDYTEEFWMKKVKQIVSGGFMEKEINYRD